jgi:dynein heavy chain
MTSRLANPHFSPELAAKTTIIDFTVTQGGLEQQLLARLISKEQKVLEEQMTQLQEDVTANTKILQSYEEQLLDRLANSQGSLLDDIELIEVLATIKTKSKEVNEKLVEAQEKKIEINEKRELFRPAAARGAVLYFCIVEMTLVNWMYNTSLAQFLGLFDTSIEFAPKAQLVKERVINIRTELTWRVYRYINRGLFERDKTTFKLMMGTKILIKDGKLTNADVGLFLKAGAGIDDRNKIFIWMTDKTWLNLKALSKHKFANDHTCFFKELPDRIQRNDQVWRSWIEENEPEAVPVPDYEEKINADPNIGSFIHLCLVRSMREDRTMLASNMFIKDVLTPDYVKPVNDAIADTWAESTPSVPVLFLLSAGADPTGSIDEYAKKHKQFPTGKVSMGEEQEIPAQALIDQSMAAGKWVVLNNCHLSLEFMAAMEDILHPKDKVVHPDFRLWITCEPHPQFPLGLLQMAIKVTTEPPNGLQAGLSRTFNTTINQDFLERVEPYDKWRQIVYSICFMHSIVQERRKFGPLGFCIPYEFNNADLQASLTFLEVHMTQCQTLNTHYSWKAMQYMVCDVQYGGRITDALDRELFNTYGLLWIQEQIFTPAYCFNNSVTEFSYCIPEATEHSKFLEEIDHLPPKDSPPIFGLHPNADLTFRLKQSNEMLTTLTDTQPKEASGGGGLSREDQVKENIEKNLLPSLPPDFIFLEVDEKLKSLKGPKSLGSPGEYDLIPLNIFLRQELQRFQFILSTVRGTMTGMCDAIDGTIIMTPELVDSINAVYDFRVPRKWQFDPTGAEISWLTPSLGGWIKGLIDRHHQLHTWIMKERPPSFWLTGFFNPQGFLTAMKQEVTRMKKTWALDEVRYYTEVQKEVIAGEDGRIEGTRGINSPPEGVFIHGLFLEGAGWSRQERKLEDSQPKELFFQFPIIHVTAICVPRNPAEAKNVPKPKVDLGVLEKTYYNCPVYKYPKRNDKYLIFRVFLKAESQGAPPNPNRGMTAPMKWKLAGVCLLCTKE